MSTSDTARAWREFASRVGGLTTYDDVLDAFEAAVRVAGYSGFTYWTYPRGTLEALKAEETDAPEFVVASRGPLYLKPLEVLYFRRSCYLEDPTLVYAENQHVPFDTERALAGTKRSKRVNIFLRLMERYAFLRDAYLPLHTTTRIQVVYLFEVGPKRRQPPQADLSETGDVLLLLGSAFVNAMSDLLEFGRPAVSNVLTTREQECLNLIARGQTSLQMADSLGVSERTVKFHVSNLVKRLDASTRAEAVAKAARTNWLIN